MDNGKAELHCRGFSLNDFFFCGDNSIFKEFGSIFFFFSNICITFPHIMLCCRPKNHHCLCHTCMACFESISKHLRNIFLYLKFCWSLQVGIYRTMKEGGKFWYSSHALYHCGCALSFLSISGGQAINGFMFVGFYDIFCVPCRMEEILFGLMILALGGVTVWRFRLGLSDPNQELQMEAWLTPLW